MSLETDIRRDTNPTPTRFLLECGAFTPGFGLSLDNYNPFDASLKFLNTGTPKAELNPFDSSFKAPSSAVAVINSSNSNSDSSPSSAQVSQNNQQGNEKQRNFDRHPWADIMFDETYMPMPPQMSPGLSPSSSSSASPSPPIRSPPPQTISLNQFHPSMATDAHTTRTHAYDHSLVFENRADAKELSHNKPSHAQFPRETLAPSEIHNTHPVKAARDVEHHPDNSRMDLDDDEDEEDDREERHETEEYDSDVDQDPSDQYNDSGVDSAMSALAMRRFSTMSDVQSNAAFDNDSHTSTKASKATGKAAKAAKSSKKAAAAMNAAIAAGARKTKGAVSKSSSRKRSSEDDSPEAKRQKFLERNRMAASKCREKKRLQTLKTISDADEITARNQALHETLDQLQEEVRRLKNQILGHRDCGCDVIQKFVKTSFGYNAPSASTYAVPPMQPHY
ncbi:hypothetical protein BC939DRAFT_467284 [Gamsiella multidivaricata]|uniref:uncharacterized protein n=1 Tax=Gamsiella multidivaricata TaxID=101098 RepID=UPI00221E84D2|nr:uncharacterized protein BC939DRAFT_467284 [Gamsiella multidivaricata]KAG0352802.1 hypothetical protein BGZ54_002570 [Gamsiella multidivaricata]KAI7816999.1 hypothetical protein BC939DRAFT_467284 [Gamsiella multidivaricata]